jgi:branched-chain amino acid aminotransferase
MNLFIVWIHEDGQKELVTPPLDDTILAGLTRDSILELARNRLSQAWKVSERRITMSQIMNAAENDRLLEIFGTGTSGTVAPVRAIMYNGKDIQLPGKGIGPVAGCLQGWLEGIQYGDEPGHPWSVVLL